MPSADLFAGYYWRVRTGRFITNSDKIGDRLQKHRDAYTNPWGIACQSLGIKDINIPSELSDAMSKPAQAERERLACTAKTEIAEKFEQANKCYQNNPVALQMSGMNTLFDGLKAKGSLIIVLSSALESINLGALGGLAAWADKARADPMED